MNLMLVTITLVRLLILNSFCHHVTKTYLFVFGVKIVCAINSVLSRCDRNMYFCMTTSGYQMKYYAVAQGRIPGIYTDWGSCFLQVHQFKGNVYKSFLTRDEAKMFIQSYHQDLQEMYRGRNS